MSGPPPQCDEVPAHQGRSASTASGGSAGFPSLRAASSAMPLVPPGHGHPGTRVDLLSPWMVQCGLRRLRPRLSRLRGLSLRRCCRRTGPTQGLDGQVALADPEVDVPTKSAFNYDLVTRPNTSGLPLRDLPVPVLEAATHAPSCPTAPAHRTPPAADAGCGAWPAWAVASTGRPPSSSPAACPGSPAARSFSPGAPQAASARSPGTADPARLPAPVPETPAAAPGSTAARAARAPRPHRLQPRTSGATDENAGVSPRFALLPQLRSALLPSPVSLTAPRCDPSPSDSSPSAPLPDPVPSLTEHDPKEDISTSLREDISKSVRHRPLHPLLAPPRKAPHLLQRLRQTELVNKRGSQ